MKKLADDYFGLRVPLMGNPFNRLVTAGGSAQRRVDSMRAQATAMNEQLREQEAYRMSQTVENFGGPGTARSRYTRDSMVNPYAVSPMLPYMGQGMMGPIGPMRPPQGSGEYRQTGEDFSDGGQDELSSLKMGAAVRAVISGRAKVAHYPAGHAEASGQYAAASAAGLRDSAVNALLAGKHGLQAAGGAVVGGLRSFGRGVRDFMSAESDPGMRWGTGMPPAQQVNDYGQPIY